jgi:hypothetical protein
MPPLRICSVPFESVPQEPLSLLCSDQRTLRRSGPYQGLAGADLTVLLIWILASEALLAKALLRNALGTSWAARRAREEAMFAAEEEDAPRADVWESEL